MRYKEFLLQVAKDWATDKVETDAACPRNINPNPSCASWGPPWETFGWCAETCAREKCWKWTG